MDRQNNLSLFVKLLAFFLIVNLLLVSASAAVNPFMLRWNAFTGKQDWYHTANWTGSNILADNITLIHVCNATNCYTVAQFMNHSSGGGTDPDDYVNRTGDTMTGNLNMDSNKVGNVSQLDVSTIINQDATVITFYDNIYSNGAGANGIGAEYNSWGSIWVYTSAMSEIQEFGSAGVFVDAVDLRPKNTKSSDLGTAAKIWDYLFVNNINASGNITANQFCNATECFSIDQLMNHSTGGMSTVNLSHKGWIMNNVSLEFNETRLNLNLTPMVNRELADNTSQANRIDTLDSDNITQSKEISTKRNLSDDILWVNLSDYPAACPTGSYLTQLEDSVTCTTIDSTLFTVSATNVTSGNFTGVYNFTGMVQFFSNVFFKLGAIFQNNINMSGYNITEIDTADFGEWDVFSNATSIYITNGTLTLNLRETSIPIGGVMAFESETCPVGWEAADGTNGHPDLRGIFVRGAGENDAYSDSSGNPYNQTFGTFTNDSMQGHRHTTIANYANAPAQDIAGNYNLYGVAGGFHAYTWTTAVTQLVVEEPTIDNAGQPRVGNETQPASYALTYCVRVAADTDTSNSIWKENAGIVSLANSTQQLVNLTFKNGTIFGNDTSVFYKNNAGTTFDLMPVQQIIMINGTYCPGGYKVYSELRDRFIVGTGANYTLGDSGGEVNHTLTSDELAAHSHTGVVGSSARGDMSAGGAFITPIGNEAIGSSGADKAHENRPPYYALLYCIRD